MLIILSSLPDKDYETFILTLINSKQSLDYHEVSSAFINHELRRKEKESSKNTSAEALMVRGRCSRQKGEGDCGRSNSRPCFRDLKKT